MKPASLLLALVSLGLMFTGVARAQYPYAQPSQAGVPYRPPISPYLNLTRPGNTAINYYGLVQPQNQLYSGLNAVQQQANLNQYNIGALGAQDPRTALLWSLTGHPVSFLNYQRYFLNFQPIPPLGSMGLGTGYGGYGAGYGGYGAGSGGYGRGYGGSGGYGGGFNPFGTTGGFSPFGTPGGQSNRPGTQLPGTGYRPQGVR
jgi:hypothetical protein